MRTVYQFWRAGKLNQLASVRALIDRFGEEETRPFLHANGETGGGNEDEDEYQEGSVDNTPPTDGKLGFRATARLSLQFCLLWVGGMILFSMRRIDC